ncbi:MAG: leucyl aminopeptidase [Candidatus Liberibacter ctenarytainae]|uniref:Probable cytosol aminopeptidase n=1 Tax=Candidatus Liberibacter ctenarytainae TaxID=2020335 RepID=A0A937AKS1_9HYPH|nr:leucyl aminopeptidase [Candidatus Liberibacter ctenarytainae]
MDVKFSFAKSPSKEREGLAILLKTSFSEAAGLSFTDSKSIVTRAATVKNFTGKSRTSLNILVPEGCLWDRLLVIGIGSPSEDKDFSWLKEGGNAASHIEEDRKIEIFIDIPEYPITEKEVRDFVLGFMLKAYTFDRYKTKKQEDGSNSGGDVSVTVITKAVDQADEVLKDISAVVNGVNLARDIVNEPANVMGTSEFCAIAKEMDNLGVEVEVLDRDAMDKLGMQSLLAVAQGSSRPPYLVVMKWNGENNSDQPPIAVCGKGVVFDSGGISIKPSNGMEEMKGDLAGAAAVTGFLRVLAERKAKVNVIGILAIVENMPDASAQRPGDIVKSMSGQTIEVLNTDAEGRLILADALWYCHTHYKPCLMIDLATLTGAIIVSLGSVYAGLFSNNDVLAEQLLSAGVSTGEILWRMPMHKDYNKMIESKVADMKNIGGRGAGSIVAAQFLEKFVQKTSWAHIDIAGTAMGKKQDEINQSWASGFGVRLLDEFIRSFHEK